MKIDKSKIQVKHICNGGRVLSINAYYLGEEIGGLYIKQDYDEDAVLNFIGDDDDELLPEPEPFIYLGLIEVYSEYRQNGVGTLLMDYFFDRHLYLLFKEENTYIKLVVHPQGLGITKEILKAFYAQYDFKPSTNNYMIREL